MKERLDRLMARRGLAESREKAQALIMAGDVVINGVKAAKPGQGVDEDAAIEVLSRPPYVSRGGLKLAAALAHFAIDPRGRVCLDAGSSTGGFTDCLLQHGALRVHAVDAGAGQLDWKLRNDPRVIVHEGVNVRHIRPEDIGEPVGLIVCDLSFISVTLVAPALAALPDASPREMVILIKPQFEVGKGQVGRKGIVRDPELHRGACERVESAVRALGFVTQIMESPILGAEGNKEFLLYARD
jgi:23S rRNA (cytidine1920-2'-O)/16S rRNA (cytidine1409-2'-O)-methyltransferase